MKIHISKDGKVLCGQKAHTAMCVRCLEALEWLKATKTNNENIVCEECMEIAKNQVVG